MTQTRYPVTASAACKELLFVGFQPDFSAGILHFPFHNPDYGYTPAADRRQAHEWLQAQPPGQLPYAIIIETSWLLEDEFVFVQELKSKANLRRIPVIALTRSGRRVEQSFFVQNGVDDCYAVPVEWSKLETRLQFLNQFKARLLQQAVQAEPEQFGTKISWGKRLFDVIGAAFLLLIVSPILLLTALAIRLESRGPIVYRARRVGTGYQVFDFLKFRSMYADADQRLSELRHLNQYKDDGSAFVKIANDPRITRVGRFIRRYSIDELPQLINVLRGEMSLVGNRPLPLYEAEQLTRDEWSARFLAPAGLTGLWQVSKRGKSDMSAEERIALDVAYSQNRSATTDLKIMLRTFGAFVQKENV